MNYSHIFWSTDFVFASPRAGCKFLARLSRNPLWPLFQIRQMSKPRAKCIQWLLSTSNLKSKLGASFPPYFRLKSPHFRARTPPPFRAPC